MHNFRRCDRDVNSEELKRDHYKTCDQVGFCRRHRAWALLHDESTIANGSSRPEWASYHIDPATVHADPSGVFTARVHTHVDLFGQASNDSILDTRDKISKSASSSKSSLQLIISTLDGGAVRVQLKEAPDVPEDLKPPRRLNLERFALPGVPRLSSFVVDKSQEPFHDDDRPAPGSNSGIVLVLDTPKAAETQTSSFSDDFDQDDRDELSDEIVSVHISYAPVQVSVHRGHHVLIVLNRRNYLRYEMGSKHLISSPTTSIPISELNENYATDATHEAAIASESATTNGASALTPLPQDGSTVTDGARANDLKTASQPRMPRVTDNERLQIKWQEIEHDGIGPEKFREFEDPQAYGPRAFGVDASFPHACHIYGLPEHAAAFDLPATKRLRHLDVSAPAPHFSQPYRLYNLDVAHYELNDPMALYGSVPWALAVGENGSAGMLMLSASEMWIDIERGIAANNSAHVHALGCGPVTHWMVESGPFDAFLFVGSQPRNVYRQYMRLVGFPTLVPKFSMAYHQCRWNYKDQDDVKQVDAGFDRHNIPYDVIWLDIEHTNGKRYFTWDQYRFASPKNMIDGLAEKGRKLVTIVDPHVKLDDQYRISHESRDLKLVVGSPPKSETVDLQKVEPFEGWCWPGSSNWIDVISTKARKWWADQLSLSKYEGSTADLFVWNDMNEPSVFSGPEITMPKHAIHTGGLEHRVVHNIYGMMLHRTTHIGLVKRSLEAAGKWPSDGRPDASDASVLATAERPFVLSRAAFIGTQRWGAIWTGDNVADWSHLAVAHAMILSLSTAGIVFSGADVGGFFNDVEPELLVRWYQAGALQPFFRAHAHIETKRREPWLFGDETTALLREAVRRRYRLLPLISTIFFDSWRRGDPIMRPVMLSFSHDKNGWATEQTFVLGDSILVRPVTAPVDKLEGSAQDPQVTVYLPRVSSNDDGLWYYIGNVDPAAFSARALSHSSAQQFDQVPVQRGGITVTVKTPLEVLPHWARGGRIVVTRERQRRSSAAAEFDPLTITVYFDKNGTATGHLVVDDGKTFGVLAGAAVEVKMKATGFGTLQASLGVPRSPRSLATSDHDAKNMKGKEEDFGDDGADTPATAPSARRIIVVNDKLRQEFLTKYGQIRVERMVLVYPDALSRPGSSSVRVNNGQDGAKDVQAQKLAENVLAIKEPGLTLGQTSWSLSFGA